MLRIGVLDDYQGVARDMADWASLGTDVETTFFTDHLAAGEALVARLRPFDVLVAMRERTPFPRSLIERLPALKLLVTTGPRNASIDVQAAQDRGIPVCGTGGLGYPTAELTWGLIIALARNIPAEERAMRGGRWQTTLGTGLNGKTLGVIGLGKLGAQVARIGTAFGMSVVAWSQNLTEARAREGGAALVSRDELLARADVVTIHLVLSERTRGLIGARELSLMKSTAYLINTSRGPIVDTGALVAALHAGKVGGAGLDVFDDEPLSPDDPLLRAPRTVLTPHLGYVTVEGYRVFFDDVVQDIQAWRAGRPVRVLAPPEARR